MKKNILYLLLSFTFLLFNANSELKAQAAVCSGTLQANTLGVYGAGTQIGNGTAGNIRVCITANTLLGSGGMCGTAQLVLSTSNGAGAVVIWSELTANGTCYTFATGTGLGWLALQCNTAGSNATITWTTVNGSGTNVCPSCSDGIQNQGETGIDCGGPCAACAPSCTDGIQNQGETGVDCGGPCGPCGGPSCSDGILNQDETGIDCGGVTCPVCPTCFDGVQNQGETGVDCGGPCALTCTTNSTPTTSTCGTCPAAAQATIYPSNCDQVGTSAYNLNSPIVNAVSCGTSTTPSPAPSCGTVGSQATWIHVDLAVGVTQVQLAFNSGSVGAGSSNTYAQAYQGTGCGALTAVPGGCQNSVQFASGVYGVYQNFFTGLNPNQDLWIFLYNDGGKAFNLNYSLLGTTGPPSNTTCATAETAIGDACNLGAPGASFATPGSVGQTCDGGNWGSNENTTFYTFTTTATTASLEIGSISCNNGVAGNAQFAVWTSCAAVGTYGAGFLGCAVASGTINLTGLVAGQTYYIAADGYAGDNCSWTFTGTNIVLPVKLLNFGAIYNKNKVDVNWITETEINNDYFTVERSKDLENFDVIEVVKGKGNSSSSRNIYGISDNNPYIGTSYYRLKQTDYDGNFEYFEPVAVSVENTFDDVLVYPNPVTGNGFIEFSSMQETAQLISIYDISGRVVYKKLYDVKKGNNKLVLETTNLTKGMYFIQLAEGAEGVNIKFIKE